jgi:hypothetical protein
MGDSSANIPLFGYVIFRRKEKEIIKNERRRRNKCNC